jgi:hypothetical protein
MSDWQKLYLESVKIRAVLEREIHDLHGQILKATSSMMGVGHGDGNLFVYGDYDSIKAAQAIVLERDALKAGLEAARKQEPYAEWKIFNKGGSGQFGQLVSSHPMRDGQKFYASPVPAPQAVTVRGIDLMSDDDIWHVAGIVRRLCNGSLYDVSQSDLVLEVRASFEDPDTAYAMLFPEPKEPTCTE